MTTFRNPVELLPEMVDRIVKGFDPLQIILFGSRARDDARPDSDIDLLVVLPTIEHKRDTLVAVMGVIGDMPVAKDIVVTTPDEIARKRTLVGNVLGPALLEGKVIYERDR